MVEPTTDDKSQHGTFLEMSSADQDDNQLAAFGDKIAKLIESPKARASHYLLATLDDLLGAVYALVLAKRNNPPFKDRTGPIEVQVVLERANQLAECRVRMAGAWMAGFQFNNALFRLAATYHRGLKVVTGNETNNNIYRDELKQRAKSSYRTWIGTDWMHAELDKIYDEVNDLKHEAEGIYQQRTVTVGEPKMAVEELLSLLEAWAAQP